MLSKYDYGYFWLLRSSYALISQKFASFLLSLPVALGKRGRGTLLFLCVPEKRAVSSSFLRESEGASYNGFD